MSDHEPVPDAPPSIDPGAAACSEAVPEGDPADLDEVVELDAASPADRFAFNDVAYVFDAGHVGTAVELLTEVGRPGHNEGEELRRLVARLGLGDDLAPLVRELWLSLNHRLSVQHHGEPAGCELGSVSGGERLSWPPRPSDASADLRALWESLAEADLPVAMAARFNDLLVVSKQPSPHVRARTAAEAYLADVAQSPDQNLHTTASLVRAWDLARRFKLQDVESVAVDSMLDYVAAGLPEFRSWWAFSGVLAGGYAGQRVATGGMGLKTWAHD